MKRICGYKWIAVFAVLLMVWASGLAMAEDRPVNPNRQKMLETDQKIEALIRELSATEAEKDEAHPNANADRIWTYNAKLTRASEAVQYGKNGWYVEVLGQHNASQVTQMTVGLYMKDWCDDYTHVYWYRVPYFQSYVQSCQYMTAGYYTMEVWLDFSDGTYGFCNDVFYVSGTDTLNQKINEVVSACRVASDWDTALNLHDWLINHVYYDPDLLYYGPDMILRGYGVCDGYSKAYHMLCRRAGIQVYRVTNGGHAWNAIALDGHWYYVDCTWDDPLTDDRKPVSGYEGHTYFCLNEALMRLDHPAPFEWAYGSKLECWALYANYDIHTGNWMKWGPDYSSGNIRTFQQAVLDHLYEGESVWTTTNDYIYWKESSKICVGYMDERTCGLIAWGLNNQYLPSPDGGLLMSASYTSSSVTVKFRGWQLDNPGTLKLPAQLKSVPDDAFYKTRASIIVIPEGCTSIGQRAFAYSSVRTVYIPNSVTSIASNAFTGSSGRILFITDNPYAIQYARNTSRNYLVAAP